jgi:hypothetical protein
VIFRLFFFCPLIKVFWTSGKDEGCESKFGWCSTGECLLPSLPWKVANPDNYLNNEHCINVAKASGVAVLNDNTCSSSARFICEVSIILSL